MNIIYIEIYNYIKLIEATEYFDIINNNNYIILIWKEDPKNWILFDLVENIITIQIYDRLYKYTKIENAINDFIFLMFGAISENYDSNKIPYEFIRWKY